VVASKKNIQTYKYGEKQQKAKEKQRANVGYTTNAASLTAFRNRLKTFLFHHTPSGCSAD